MAEVFYFHVQEDRSIKYKLLEPIMQEDKDVAVWRFRIPKVLNNIDMSAWSWWFVYVNAKNQKFSELLTLTNDIDDPENYCTADYSIGYGISKTPGGFTFALEAISAEQSGEISGEWHTRTYTHTVTPTLQGNQAEYTETESDIISALIVEVQNKYNALVGGATPLPVNLKSLMTDHDKVYLYTGSEPNESTGYWYYWNGTNFVPGGVYGAGDPESVQGYVEAWLDEHPEATTTVQDGSVVPAKMNSTFWDRVRIGRDFEIAKNTTELKATTADIVYLTSNDGIYGDGGGCWFWKHKNLYTNSYETIGGVTRNDNTVVFAMPDQSELPASSAPKSDIGKVIASYYQRTNLVYGNDKTLYNSVVANEIDCSSFVSAVLDGISYDLSRYAKGSESNNDYGDYAGSRRTGGTGGDREALLTYQLAEWFAERKRLFTIPNTKEGWGLLRFGDVLFSGSYDSASAEDNAKYYGINHCMIVLQTFPNEGNILVAQAGGTPNTVFSTTTRTVKISLINLGNGIGTHYNVFARPAYGDGNDNGVNISGLISTKGEVTADGSESQKMAAIACSVPMTSGNLYTITIKGDLPVYSEDGCWLYAKALTTSRASADQYNLFRLYQLSGNGKETTFIGCLDFVNGTVMGVTGLEVYLQSANKIGTPAFEVKEIALIEGVDFNAGGSKPLKFTIDDNENFSLSKNESTIANGRFLIELAVSKNTTVTGDKAIGHFEGLYGTPARNKTILGRKGNTDVRVFRISSSGTLMIAASAETGTYYITAEYIPSIFN